MSRLCPFHHTRCTRTCIERTADFRDTGPGQRVEQNEDNADQETGGLCDHQRQHPVPDGFGRLQGQRGIEA